MGEEKITARSHAKRRECGDGKKAAASAAARNQRSRTTVRATAMPEGGAL